MDKRNLEKLVMEERNEELKNMLQDRGPSKLIDDSGMTLLHLAAKHNKLELIKYLLSVGFDINARNSDRITPILIALFCSQLEAMKILLQWNADIFAVDSQGRSSIEILMREMEELPAEVVMCIAENYKRSNLDSETKAEIVAKARVTLQSVVTVCDNLATAMFLERNDDIRSYEFSGAVKFAMEREDYESVRTILKKMPYDKLDHLFFDQLDRFFLAEPSDDIKYAELFMKRALEWNVMDESIVMSEFGARLTKSNKKIVERFLHADFDVYIRKKFGIEILTSLFGNSNIDAIELVRNRAFLVSGKGALGYSALHLAVRQGFKAGSDWEKNVRFLLDIGADPNVKDTAGLTPLCFCVLFNCTACVTLLLQYGADIQLGFPPFELMFDRAPGSRTFAGNVIAQLALDDARGLPIETSLRNKIMFECSSTFEKCLMQIEEFKKHEILDSVTVFTVLTATFEELARRLRGEDCFSKLKDYCQKRKIHDYYNSTLKFKLDRASKMNIAKSNFAKVVSQKAGILVGFDHLVVDKIFSYFTYYDMLQLV